MSRRRLEKLHRHRLCSMSALRGVLRGSRGLPGGRRELSGGSSGKFSGPKWIENGAFESDFAHPTRRSVSKTTRVLGEIDLSCPILSFPVYDFSLCAGNDEPWFENNSNSCVATVLSSFAISLLGGRRMWPQASPIRRPQGWSGVRGPKSYNISLAKVLGNVYAGLRTDAPIVKKVATISTEMQLSLQRNQHSRNWSDYRIHKRFQEVLMEEKWPSRSLRRHFWGSLGVLFVDFLKVYRSV